MDPLSFTASLIAVLETTAEVISYLNDVRSAPKECAEFAIEASSLYSLLVALKYRLEEGRSNEAWFASVRSLGVKNGPLDQYKEALEHLAGKVSDVSKIRMIGRALTWKFGREEVNNILAKIERLKGLISIALEMDHL
jgi:hypothetical protein